MWFGSQQWFVKTTLLNVLTFGWDAIVFQRSCTRANPYEDIQRWHLNVRDFDDRWGLSWPTKEVKGNEKINRWPLKDDKCSHGHLDTSRMQMALQKLTIFQQSSFHLSIALYLIRPKGSGGIIFFSGANQGAKENHFSPPAFFCEIFDLILLNCWRISTNR